MIKFYPKKGTILCCDFSKGFQPPEMVKVKVRPVIVITPQLPGRPGLCTVVPISSVEPKPMQAYHHKMNPSSLTPKQQGTDCWAKCDMIYTVALERLDRVRERESSGKLIYVTSKATAADIERLSRNIKRARVT